MWLAINPHSILCYEHSIQVKSAHPTLLGCFLAPLTVLSTMPVNGQQATPSILLHWYLVNAPLHPQLNWLQAISAPHKVQPSLLVKDQCGQPSTHMQVCTLIIPNVQHLDGLAFCALFSCTSQGAVHPTPLPPWEIIPWKRPQRCCIGSL